MAKLATVKPLLGTMAPLIASAHATRGPLAPMVQECTMAAAPHPVGSHIGILTDPPVLGIVDAWLSKLDTRQRAR